MPPLVSMQERAGTHSPANFAVALDAGTATVPLRLTDETQLEDAVLAIIGDVEPMTDGSGRLHRICPLRHARFKGFYGERVSSGEGVGKGLFQPTRLAPGENGNSLDDFALYGNYVLTTQFRLMPYQVRPDADITYGTVTWTDVDGTNRTDKWAAEYDRFCDFEAVDAGTWVDGNQGQWYFAAGVTLITGPGRTPPHGSAFTGVPRLPIPETALYVNWYNVPYDYVCHPQSRLRQLKERVNITSLFGYPQGTLLYRGYTVTRRWTPFKPVLGLVEGSAASLQKCCDLRLEFRLRDTVTVTGPANTGNRLFLSPFNAAPAFVDGKWYSIIIPDPSNVNDGTKWKVIYASAPLEMLFCNPAA